MVKKAMDVFLITKSEIIEEVKKYRTSQVIRNYILSHMSWNNSTNNSFVNVLVNKENSCYINSVLQCLARIPALTQILLDTNLFQNMNTTTFLHKYISLLTLMTEKKQSDETIFYEFFEQILRRKSKL